MATVRLSPEQCAAGDLPPLCARCGRPATAHLERTFTWHPPWAAALILLLVVPGVLAIILTTRRQAVRLPLCDRHRRHWANPTAFALAAGGVFGASLVFLLILLDDRPAVGRVVTSSVIWLVLVCVVVIGLWQARLIRPERIDAKGIVLTGVSTEFAEAAKVLRGGPADRDDTVLDDEDDRPRRNRYEGDEEA